jgi:hypothetical protein
MVRNVIHILLVFLLSLFLAGSASAQNNKGISYVLLVDNTGSMRSQFSEALFFADGIVDRIPDQSTGSIFHFTSKTNAPAALLTEGIGWTKERILLKQYLGGIYIVAGQTALLDAINSVADRLNEKVNNDSASSNEKIVFLVTDGEDRVSKTKQKQLVEKLKESNIKVYIIGLVKALDRTREDAIHLLKRIANESGGRLVLSRSQKDDAITLLNELFAK